MKFSIIITGYNQKEVACDAVRSALDQTHQDVEVIYVDDASTDGSADYIEAAFHDQRLWIVRCTENRGSLVSRLQGIKAATGDWCLFVDGDDTLCLNACEVLANTIADQDADTDIIGFGANIICSEFVSEDTKKWMESMACEPLLGVHRIEDLLDIQYGKREKAWLLWNKCFKLSVLLAAEASAVYESFFRLTDYYLCFLVCSEGTQYFGISDHLYNYSYGPGISLRSLDLNGFVNFMSAFKATPLLKKYASEKGLLNKYETCFDAVERETVILSGQRLVRMAESDQLDASRAFADAFGPQGILILLSEQERLNQQVGGLNQHIADLNHNIHLQEQIIDDLHDSVSFRIGRAMTWLPRKIRNGVRCYREHGLRYTIQRFLSSLLRNNV